MRPQASHGACGAPEFTATWAGTRAFRDALTLTLNVRRWDRIVEAWAAGDDQGLDDEWTTDVLPDLGSQWGQYEYVTNIGFAA
ncbi:hypothetical protein EES42_41975 [Streptomyces sp. ADI95-17]|nr:hypothetical protein EES42_41975 [Streptomyces sp. ADI95-17]